MTALHEAAKRSYAGAVQVLVRGIPPRQLKEALNAKDAVRFTAFCLHGLKHADTPSAHHQLERTPLHWAAVGDRGEAVTALAKAGADLAASTGKKRTALHAAAYVGAESSLAALLAAGAPHSARDDAGDEPLHDAASQGFNRCVEMLIAAGADPKATNHAGTAPIQLAPPGELRAWMGAPLASAASTGDVKRLRALLRGGVNPNATDAAGATALHMAARHNSVACAKVLLKAGTFVDLPDKMRNTALHYAAGFGSYEVAEFLMAKGACTGIKNANGMLPHQVVPLQPPSAEALAAAAADEAEVEAARVAKKAAAKAARAAEVAAAKAAAERAAKAAAAAAASPAPSRPASVAPSAPSSVSERSSAQEDEHEHDVLMWLHARAQAEDGAAGEELDGDAMALVESLTPMERRAFLVEAQRRGPEAAAIDLFERHGVIPLPPAKAMAPEEHRDAWDYTWGDGKGDEGANEKMAAIERRILAQAAAGHGMDDNYSSSEDEFEHGRAPEPTAYVAGFARADSYDNESGSWSLPSSRPPSPPRPRIRRVAKAPSPAPSEVPPSEPESLPVPEALPSDLLARYDIMMQRADARRAGLAPKRVSSDKMRQETADKMRKAREEQKQKAAKSNGKSGRFDYDSDGELRMR